MSRSKSFLAVIVLTLLGTPALAEVGEWYVLPSIVHFDDDADRAIADQLAGLQVSVGKELNERFIVEGVLGYYDIDGWFEDQKQYELGVNLITNIAPQWRFSPHVLAGVGYLGTSNQFSSGQSSPTASLGLGFNLPIGDSRWAVFGHYRWRTAWGEEPAAWQQKDSYTDRMGAIGVRYSFGDRSLPDPAAIEKERYAAPPPPPPESDLDGDGVADVRDDCPGTRPGITVNSSGCPADSDLDGVSDDNDRCPGTVAGVRVDSLGCELREVIELRGVYFENDSDVLIPGAERVLAQAAATLLANPTLKVEIAGHTDSSGDAGRNIHLSLRRAFAVRSFLIDAGVNPDNLTARGYGESSPVASNTTEAGRAENRRVELRVLNR